MANITIIYKYNLERHFHGAEEYYCTEKMFFVKCNDGKSFYISNDEISMVVVEEDAE